MGRVFESLEYMIARFVNIEAVFEATLLICHSQALSRYFPEKAGSKRLMCW